MKRQIAQKYSDLFLDHWDCPSDANTKHPSNTLKSTTQFQHAQEYAQIHGHIIDHVISYNSLILCL